MYLDALILLVKEHMSLLLEQKIGENLSFLPALNVTLLTVQKSFELSKKLQQPRQLNADLRGRRKKQPRNYLNFHLILTGTLPTQA